jgi:hypothetical protein
MEDEPLLHPGQLDDLVLEYLFGDGHRESFPKRNPHMKRLMHMMINVMNSTIAESFQAGNFCLEVFAFGGEVFKGVGCFVANIP